MGSSLKIRRIYVGCVSLNICNNPVVAGVPGFYGWISSGAKLIGLVLSLLQLQNIRFNQIIHPERLLLEDNFSSLAQIVDT